MTMYKIRSLGYDPEADELDLLINSETPQPAEAIPLEHGIYIRRAFKNGAIVGAFIRGYRDFARQVSTNRLLSGVSAENRDLADAFAAIVEWQREVGELSHQLADHLESWPPQDSFLQVLVKN